MAFRRRTFRGRRPFRRRGGFIRQEAGLRRWQSATFAASDQELQVTTVGFGDAVSIAVELMSPELLFTESGDNLVHKYEIGGVVWQSHFFASTINAGARALVHESVYAQRLDNIGQPVFLWNPFRSTEPLGSNAETSLPTHVYLQRSTFIGRFPATDQDRSAEYVGFDKSWKTQNLRIKRSLNDFQGLFIGATLAGIDFAAGANITVQWSVWGTLFFRFRT